MTAEIVKIHRDSLTVDEEFNARQLYDEHEIKALATQIRRDGLLTPVLVQQISEEGDEEKSYYLIAGFRRCKAVFGEKDEGGLGKDEIDAMVVERKSELDYYFMNLAENETRENLTPCELAHRSKLIRDKFDMSPGKIAGRLGKRSNSYIANLIRVVECVNPKILEIWKDPNAPENKVCTTSFLTKLSSIKNHEEQWELFEKKTGVVDEGSPTEGNGNGVPDPQPRKHTRPSVKHLEAAFKAVSKDATVQSSVKKGIKQALKYAMGKNVTLSVDGIVHYDPTNPPSDNE